MSAFWVNISGPGEIFIEINNASNTAVVPLPGSRGVTSPLGLVRNDLDDWVQREYIHGERPNVVFADLYYGNPRSDVPISRQPAPEIRQRWVTELERVRAILEEHYAACAPVRALLSKLGRAKASIEKWRP
ncbi:DUF5623 domain-containing protein [Halomonas sp. WWR20]